MNRLADKVALVTGSSRGIGKAIAQAFCREGASVVLCGRRQESLEAAARELPSERVLAMTCHVGRLEELESLVQRTRQVFGRIDILVNNAATNIAFGPCLEMDDAQFDKMVEINVKSAFRLVRLVAPEMCARRSGVILNIASTSGLRPQPHAMLYSMTKAALIMMTKSWALELGAHGVRVNAIAPGLVETRFSEYYWKDPDRLARYLGRQPLGRAGRPEEVAEVAVMLASDDASYMTGGVVVVDGGLLVS
ncbi:MAG: SDR family oxidoreductase [Bryobacterales bacterium]|nr:SDR family oxidoreductase [Bryobacteraceae bacterium]MDW8354300.1 SDR family oxidoreductase [Bryobacterales bacterium]